MMNSTNAIATATATAAAAAKPRERIGLIVSPRARAPAVPHQQARTCGSVSLF